MFTLFLDRGCRRTSLADSGGFQTVTPPAGVGTAQRLSLRSWARSTAGSRRTTSPTRQSSARSGGVRGGAAVALPAASLVLGFYRLFPSPVPVSVLSVLKGYFLWEQMRGTLSSFYTDAPRILAFSSLCAELSPASAREGNFWRHQPGPPGHTSASRAPEGTAHALPATPARLTSAPTVPCESNHGSHW